ncbi:MAG: 4Fe-4S dicluster domain-containing protein [bacterium]|nr:4Fe-4S dicluster domain-containing protein [bacterium]
MCGYIVETIGQHVEAKIEQGLVPLLRPPGAINELSFLLKCTRCDLCLEACPHDAIVKAESQYGSAQGTPIIKPSGTPCYLCEGYPCIKACPDEALLPVEKVRMGTAHVIQNTCLAYNGQVCDYCFDRCPLKREAIVMESRKPRVIEANCTGCGICEYFCPAPAKGIKVLPNPIISRD